MQRLLCLTDVHCTAGSKGLLSPQSSEEAEWLFPLNSAAANGGIPSHSARTPARSQHNGGRPPARGGRRQLGFALLAAAAVWLLLTGIYTGSLIRTPASSRP